MPALTLHPHCPTGSIERIDASVEATASGCRAVFAAYGDVARIKLPGIEADRGRCDDLWRTTCFEIFWQPEGGTYYREFNLSPSTRWAAYDFDDVRKGMRNAPAEIMIETTVNADRLTVTADIVSDLPRPARVALNGIIEEAGGVNRFWALAFAAGKPEFHSEICRALRIGA